MLQDLDLYLAHQHGVDLSQLLIPHVMKLRLPPPAPSGFSASCERHSPPEG